METPTTRDLAESQGLMRLGIAGMGDNLLRVDRSQLDVGMSFYNDRRTWVEAGISLLRVVQKLL